MRYRTTLFLIAVLWLALSSSRAQVQDPRQAQDPKTEEAPEQAGEVLSIEPNLVVLNVTITDAREQYVGGLKAEQFKIFEDNKPQKIVSFGYEETPFATALLLDASGSMENKLTLERAACTTFVDGIREGDNY